MAKIEKRKPAEFDFHSFALDNEALHAAARRLKISRRALLYALVLHAERAERRDVGKPKGKQMIAYSTLSHRQVRLEDDSSLKLRMEVLAHSGPDDFAGFARALAQALDQQDRTELFTQFLYNRIIGVHRRLQRFVPWLYRGAFFGFSPYDIVLSLLPPIRPTGLFGELRDAVFFGGSFTGTTPSCVMLPGLQMTTLTFWLERKRSAVFRHFETICRQNGIEAQDWSTPARGNAEAISDLAMRQAGE